MRNLSVEQTIETKYCTMPFSSEKDPTFIQAIHHICCKYTAFHFVGGCIVEFPPFAVSVWRTCESRANWHLRKKGFRGTSRFMLIILEIFFLNLSCYVFVRFVCLILTKSPFYQNMKFRIECQISLACNASGMIEILE